MDDEPQPKHPVAKLLVRGTSSEEIVSYRGSFISYWATPFFLIGIFLIGVVSWSIRVSEKRILDCEFFWIEKEQAFRSPIGNPSFTGTSQQVNIDDLNKNVKPVLLNVPGANSFYSNDSIDVKFKSRPSFSSFQCKVEIQIYGRFLFKIVENAAKNLKFKIPEKKKVILERSVGDVKNEDWREKFLDNVLQSPL